MPQIRSSFGLGLYGGFDPDSKDTWAGTPLTIEELTGEQRELQLRGKALPEGPLSLPLKRRARVTYYQGQTAATTHVLGVEQGECSMSGRWLSQELASDDFALFRSTFLAELEAVRSAEDLREIVYSLVRDGQELRVTWAGVERFAAAIEFDPRHWHRGDIEWSLDFTWSGEGKFVALPVQDTVEGSSQSLFDVAAELLDDARMPAELALDLVDVIEREQLRIEGLIAELRDTVTLYTTGVSRLLEVSGRAAGIVERIRASALLIRDEVLALPAAAAYLGVTAGTPSGMAVQRRIQQWIAETKGYSRRTAAEAARMLATFESALRDPSLDRIWLVRGDTDLRMVAQQVWGNPHAWSAIADYNGLENSTVAGGTTLRIPAQPEA